MALDFSLLRTIISDFDLGLGGYLMPIIIVLLITIAITRNTRHMRLIALPIAVGLTRIGLDIHFIITATLGILWATTIVGTHIIGGFMTSVGDRITGARDLGYKGVEGLYKKSKFAERKEQDKYWKDKQRKERIKSYPLKFGPQFDATPRSKGFAQSFIDTNKEEQRTLLKEAIPYKEFIFDPEKKRLRLKNE